MHSSGNKYVYINIYWPCDNTYGLSDNGEVPYIYNNIIYTFYIFKVRKLKVHVQCTDKDYNNYEWIMV